MPRPVLAALLLLPPLLVACDAAPPPPPTLARPVPQAQPWERAPTSSLPDGSQRLLYMGQGRFGVMGGTGAQQGVTLPGRSGPGVRQDLRVQDVGPVDPAR